MERIRWHKFKDKLKEGRVGTRALSSEVGVLIWVSTYGTQAKYVYVKDESSQNMVSWERKSVGSILKLWVLIMDLTWKPWSSVLSFSSGFNLKP